MPTQTGQEQMVITPDLAFCYTSLAHQAPGKPGTSQLSAFRFFLGSSSCCFAMQALNASFERYEEERRLQGMRERDAMLSNTAA